MRNLSLSLLVLLTSACGAQKDDESTVTSSTSPSESAGLSIDEALNAMADADQENTSNALWLDGSDRTVTKTCTAIENSAKVDVNASYSQDSEKEYRFGTVSQSVNVNAELSRTWSKPGSTIACGANGKHAAIDFNGDIADLKLQVDFSRTIEREMIRTKKDGSVLSKSVSIATSGTRSVTWVSITTLSDLSVVRSKLLSSDAKSVRRVLKDSETVDSIDLSLATEASAPLAIDVSFPTATSIEPSSRTIKSGKLIATVAGSGRVESVFDNLKLSFSGTDCQPESGSVISSAFDEGSSTATLVIKIEAEDGSYIATNITDAANPVVLEYFEYQLCDIRNFNN